MVAEPFIAALTETLPESLRACVKPFMLRFEHNQEIQVPISGTCASEIVDIWNSRLRSESNFKYRVKETERALYCVPERSPDEQPRYRKIGQLRGFMEKKAGGGANLEVKWKPR